MKTILKKAKQTLSLLLVLLTVCSCIPMYVSADEGSDETFIEVYTIEDLYNISDNLSANYILMNDIDLTEVTATGGDWNSDGKGWMPIGAGVGAFTGDFDGNGKKIIGLQVNRSSAGLFENLSGNVYDLTMEEVNISGSSYVGAFSASSDGATFTNCFVYGQITTNSTNTRGSQLSTGGFVGNAISTCFVHSVNHATILGGTYTGGFAGTMSGESYIEKCFNIGSIISDVSRGYKSGGTNTPGFKTGNYTYNYAGGFVGETTGNVTITSCYNCAEITVVTGTDYENSTHYYRYYGNVGGIVGTGSSTINKCYNSGILEGKTCKAIAPSGTIESCYFLNGTGSTITGAAPLTESQMKLKSMYKGFDFENTWVINPHSDYPYPQLRNNLQSEDRGHTFGEWQTVTASTCTEYGKRERYCECGEKETEQIEPAHTFSSMIELIAATCTTDGKSIRICEVCSTNETVTIPATGHSWGELFDVTEPTCKIKGSGKHTCATCKVTETVEIDTLEHNWGENFNFVEGTCVVDESYDHTCLDCGTTETVVVTPAPGHKNTDWSIITEPTCSADGLQIRLCTVCKQTEQGAIEKLPHTYGEWTIITDATCGADGEKQRTCTICGLTRSRVIPATGEHTYGEWVLTTKPTCKDEGVETKTCSVCGATETKAVPTTDHSYGDWKITVLPGCVEDGTQVKTCSVCGTQESTSVDATGHIYGAWSVTTQPTCTEKGVESKTCMSCGDVATRPVDEKGHTYGEWIVTTDPTCTEEGVETKYCKDCDHSTTQSVPANGHDLGEWVITVPPTCLDQGLETKTCKVCGATTKQAVPATGHSLGDWVITTEPTCELDGVETKSCADCDYTETQVVPATKHNLGEWVVTTEPTCTEEGVETKYCSKCDYTQTQSIPTIEHNLGETIVVTEPTCANKGSGTQTCADCGHVENVEISATGNHVYDEWKEVTAPDCVNEGKEKHSCTVCGNTEYQPIPANGIHNFGSWYVSKKPTCVKEGTESRVCAVCGETENKSIDATGEHTYGNWGNTTNPTCGKDGEKKRTCTVCGDVQTKAVPATGDHSYGSWKIYKESTYYEVGEKRRTCKNCDAYESQTNPKLPYPGNIVTSKEAYLPFEDVKDGKWYTDGVKFCYVNGVVTGVTDYTFEPSTALTRGMFVVMLAGAVDADVSVYAGKTSFKDVKTTSWYANAVEWAYQNGYVSGMGEGYFSPKTNITRQQMCVLLEAYMTKNGYKVSINKNALNKFTDANTISSWAKDGVIYTVSAGLMNGTTDTLISPKTELTRAQATTILMQFLKNYHYGEKCLHNNMIGATCTESAKCADCGMKSGLPLGHECGDLTCANNSRCFICGETVYASSGLHEFLAATCTKPRTCKECGVTRGSKYPHEYTAATCTKPKTCTVCGTTTGSTLPHNYAAATCTTPMKCKICGTTTGSKAAHNYSAATCTARPKCTVCGAVNGNALGHHFVGTTCTTSGKCSRCSTVQNALGHSMSNGKCTRCGYTNGSSSTNTHTKLLNFISSNGKINNDGNRYVDYSFRGSNGGVSYVNFERVGNTVEAAYMFTASNGVELFVMLTLTENGNGRYECGAMSTMPDGEIIYVLKGTYNVKSEYVSIDKYDGILSQSEIRSSLPDLFSRIELYGVNALIGSGVDLSYYGF